MLTFIKSQTVKQKPHEESRTQDDTEVPNIIYIFVYDSQVIMYIGVYTNKEAIHLFQAIQDKNPTLTDFFLTYGGKPVRPKIKLSE